MFISDNYFDLLPNKKVSLELVSNDVIDLNVMELQYISKNEYNAVRDITIKIP